MKTSHFDGVVCDIRYSKLEGVSRNGKSDQNGCKRLDINDIRQRHAAAADCPGTSDQQENVARHLRGTHNRPSEEWGKLIGDVPSATAILNRFLHHAEIINITGRSYRLKDRACPKGK
ncbi:MAG: ATP-binding protein [bacterium]